MTIRCYTSIYGIRIWLMDCDKYSVKFQLSYRNNRYNISHNAFGFTVFNFGDEGE